MKEWFLGQLAMYAAYHRDRRNQATHHVGVPMIVFSLLVIASTVPLGNLGGMPVTLAMVIIALVLLLYLAMVPLVGLVALVEYGALTYLAGLVAAMGTGVAVKAFAALFIVGWVIQFIGHAYEGRKPALFDNLVQIFMAPAFLIAEILFGLGLGSGLKQQITARMGPFMPKAEQA